MPLVYDCRKGDSRRFGPLVQRALVGGPTKSSEGLQCLEPDCQVNLSHFEDLLQEIDNTLRSLPATGQVAPHHSSSIHSFVHSFFRPLIHLFSHSVNTCLPLQSGVLTALSSSRYEVLFQQSAYRSSTWLSAHVEGQQNACVHV